ncbi:hypothetical protein GCM10023220_65820 [Streptomyces ziwulingensis]|uniref:Uncharacterized protein n=1 Tax=Streptomyces ziwulingensis TaxID=1045501 RepID=A0ABP9D2E5_9ACTN
MAFNRFSGRVALVTGGGSGIGAAIALRLAGEGATTVIAGRNEEKLSRTVTQAPEGSTIVQRTTDVRDEAAVIELIDGTVEVYGRLDVSPSARPTRCGTTMAGPPTVPPEALRKAWPPASLSNTARTVSAPMTCTPASSIPPE